MPLESSWRNVGRTWPKLCFSSLCDALKASLTPSKLTVPSRDATASMDPRSWNLIE